MLWRGRRQSDNIEDARGQGGGGLPGGFGRSGGPIRIPIGGGAGGGGITGIIILVVLFFALRACGIDPMQMLNGGGGHGHAGRRRHGQRDQPAGHRRDEAVRGDRAGRDRGHLERHLPGRRAEV